MTSRRKRSTVTSAERVAEARVRIESDDRLALRTSLPSSTEIALAGRCQDQRRAMPQAEKAHVVLDDISRGQQI